MRKKFRLFAILDRSLVEMIESLSRDYSQHIEGCIEEPVLFYVDDADDCADLLQLIQRQMIPAVRSVSNPGEYKLQFFDVPEQEDLDTASCICLSSGLKPTFATIVDDWIMLRDEDIEEIHIKGNLVKGGRDGFFVPVEIAGQILERGLRTLLTPVFVISNGRAASEPTWARLGGEVRAEHQHRLQSRPNYMYADRIYFASLRTVVEEHDVVELPIDSSTQLLISKRFYSFCKDILTGANYGVAKFDDEEW